MRIAAGLKQHDRRRAGGVPTLSLLSSEAHGARWRSSRREGVVEVTLGGVAGPELRGYLLAALAAAMDRDALLAELSTEAGRDRGELEALLRAPGPERQLFVERLAPELRGVVGARFCGEALAGCGGLLQRTRRALLVRLGRTDDSDRCLRVLEELAEAEPRLPIAVVGWRWPATPRLLARAREWFVQDEGAARSDPAAPEPTYADASPPAAPLGERAQAGPCVAPGRHGTTEGTHLDDANSAECLPDDSTRRRALQSALREGPAERARSAAEALLHRALSTHPELAGRFALNERLAGVGEVDLLCTSARVAVEIDGWHHFQQPSAYRRDRDKDLALQRAGYTVVRVLAQDVLAHLEPILGVLRDLIEERT
jgi:very-short-patch-repair endonuclease